MQSWHYGLGIHAYMHVATVIATEREVVVSIRDYNSGAAPGFHGWGGEGALLSMMYITCKCAGFNGQFQCIYLEIGGGGGDAPPQQFKWGPPLEPPP